MAYVPTQGFMIGPYASGSAAMVNLESAGTPPDYVPPHFTFVKFTKPITLGDGTVRGSGWTTVTWHWDVITMKQRDWLRTYCTGQSSEVWMRTLQTDNAEAYVTYRAVMVWPIQNEVHDAHRRMSFDIKFQRCTPS